MKNGIETMLSLTAFAEQVKPDGDKIRDGLLLLIR